MTDEKNPFDLMRMVGLGKKEKPDKNYAGLNRRMMAATIDSVLILIFLAPLIEVLLNMMYGPVQFSFDEAMLQMREQPNEEAAKQFLVDTMRESGLIGRWVANSMLQTIAGCAATWWCWRRWSATPGKMLLRMKIVDAISGENISESQIILRLAGYFVSGLFFFLGFIWIGFDKKRQGWHDKLAGTIVIIEPKKKKAPEQPV